MSTSGATGCTACSEGTYHTDGVGTTTPGEATSLDTTDTFGSIYPIIPNTCRQCPANTYLPLRGQAAIASMNLAAVSSATPCRPCEDGTWSKAGAAGCQKCPPGTYRNTWFSGQLGSPFITADGVPVATTLTELGSGCSQCPPGTYAPTFGMSVCLPCPAGTFASAPGATACQVRNCNTCLCFVCITILTLDRVCHCSNASLAPTALWATVLSRWRLS